MAYFKTDNGIRVEPMSHELRNYACALCAKPLFEYQGTVYRVPDTGYVAHKACYENAFGETDVGHTDDGPIDYRDEGASTDVDKDAEAPVVSGGGDGQDADNDEGMRNPRDGGDVDNKDGTSEDKPMVHEQVIQIMYNAEALKHHLHRQDLWKLASRFTYLSSQSSKDELATGMAQYACSMREREIHLHAKGNESSLASCQSLLLQLDEAFRVMFLDPDRISPGSAPAEKYEQRTAAAEQKAREADAARRKAEQRAEEAAQAKAEAEQRAIDAEGVVKRIEIPGKTTIQIDGQHKDYENLATLVLAGVPVMLVGPAGGGKTEGCRSLAADMDAEFIPLSLGPQTTQASLFGYTDAGGNVVRTPFREAFEHGGLILLDEFDRCNERVSVTLNAAVAQRYCSFPDGPVTAHEDCYIVAASNTTGHGADRQYVSARQQDAATLDRFAVLEWGYDERFEEELTKAQGLDEKEATAWLKRVRRVRKRCADLGMRYLVSPRASIQGARLMAAGADIGLACNTILFRGWKEEDRNKVAAFVDQKEGK